MSARKVLYLEPVGGIAGDMFLAAAVDLGVSPEAIEQGLAGLKVPGWRLSTDRQSATRSPARTWTWCWTPRRARSTTGRCRRSRPHPPGGHAARAGPGARAARVPGDRRGGGPDPQRASGGDPLPRGGRGGLHRGHLRRGAGAGAAGRSRGVLLAAAAGQRLRPRGARQHAGAGPGHAGDSARRARALRGRGGADHPTGAALLKALARIESPRELVVERVGYGVGTKDFRDRPNVLRASLGRAVHGEGGAFVVEANLDDCSPQLLGGLIEQLLELGALDALVLPATMKKSRPGHLLQVVATGDKRDAVISMLLAESTTLGVRFHRVERSALDRSFAEVQTRFGPVPVKLGLRNGQVLNAHPEYEDCRRLARDHAVPIKQVMAEALAAYHRQP